MFKFSTDIIKDIDAAKREVTFIFSKFNEYDSDNDLTAPGAFKKTITEQGPTGADRIRHVWNHETKTIPPIGKVMDMWEDKTAAYARSKMLNSQLANDVLDGYVNGAIKEHSYWGKSFNHGVNEKGGKILKEIKLMEVSTVLWGAQEKATLVGIQKGEIKDVSGFAAYVDELADYVRKSNASDEFLKELEIELMKASDLLKALDTTGREIAPAPVEPQIVGSLAELYKLI
jgi:HK97 family phage prohead protease